MRPYPAPLAVFLIAAGMGIGCEPDVSENNRSPSPEAGYDTTQLGADTDGDLDASDIRPVDTDTDSGPTDTTTTDSEIVDTGMDTSTDTGMDRPMDATRSDAFPANFGAGSYLREFYIDSETPGQPRCCFDLDGSGDNDNEFADFLDNVGMLVDLTVSDVNANIDQKIQDGDLVYLFEYEMWDSSNVQDDGTIRMYGHSGRDAQSPIDDNLTGDGTFEILPENYDTSGAPRSKFASTSTTGGVLTAEGGSFVLPLDIGSKIEIPARLQSPKVTATVDSNADVAPGGTVALTDGKLGGAIPKSDIYRGINRAVSDCSCLEGQKLLVPDSSQPNTFQCTSPKSSCSCENQMIVESCAAFRDQVNAFLDIDTNSDGDPDAVSFGASFVAVGAEIVGVAGQ